MSDLNNIVIMGRLTRAPELRTLPTGDTVTKLSIASGRSYKTRAGELKEDTCFVDVSVWGNQAKVCAAHLIKGQRVAAEGRLMLRQWETADKQKRRKHEIHAGRVTFLEKPRAAAMAPSAPVAIAEKATSTSEEDDLEIPF